MIRQSLRLEASRLHLATRCRSRSALALWRRCTCFFSSHLAGKRGRRDTQLLTDTLGIKECTWLASSRAEQEATLRKTVADDRDAQYPSACIQLIKIIKSVILVNNVRPTLSFQETAFCSPQHYEFASSVDRFIKFLNSKLRGTIISGLASQSSAKLIKTTERCAMNCNTSLNSSTCPVPLRM